MTAIGFLLLCYALLATTWWEVKADTVFGDPVPWWIAIPGVVGLVTFLAGTGMWLWRVAP